MVDTYWWGAKACAVTKPLCRMELCPWGSRKVACHQHQGEEGKRSAVYQGKGKASENGHIAASHKPPVFLCSMFQEDYYKAFCQGLESAAVQYFPVWLLWIHEESQGCHGWAVYLQWTQLEVLFLLAMSATHAEKNRMSVRKEWWSGIGDNTFTVMTVMCCYSGWLSQCYSEVLLTSIKSPVLPGGLLSKYPREK